MTNREMQRGAVALLPVVMLAALMVSLLATIFYRHELSLERATRVVTQEQAMLMGLSLERWAANVLLRDAQSNRTDSLADRWAQPISRVHVEDMTVSGCIVDEQARLNVNNFSRYPSDQLLRELEPQLSSLVNAFIEWQRAAGDRYPEATLARLIDWLDEDDERVSVDGAEDIEYIRVRPPRRPANAMFSQLEELALVLGFDSRYLPAVERVYVVLPEVTRINVNTVEPALLNTLVASDGGRIAQALLAQRPFNSLADVAEVVAESTGVSGSQQRQRLLDTSILDVKSHYFLLAATLELASTKMAYEAHFRRDEAGVSAVYMRKATVIPALADAAAKENDNELPAVCTHKSQGVIA